MIWPFLWALCAVLALMCWLTSQGPAWRALAAVLTAYVAVKGFGAVFGDHGIYLACGALIWAITATAVNRIGHTTPSGIIMISALCYFLAASSGAPRVVGSLPFVASDVLMVIAMVWIGWHGVGAFTSGTFNVVSGRIGDIHLSGNADVSALSKEAQR